MQRLLARLAVLRSVLVLPGRVRVVAQDRLAGAWDEAEWHGADAAETIAAAAGAALAEQPRGGVVVALVVAGPEVAPALAAAMALAPPLLVAVAGAGEADLASYRAIGWAVPDAEAALPPLRPSVLAVAAVAGAPVLPRVRERAPVREWAPVRLAGLAAWRREAHTGVDAALSALAAREARVLVVHAHPRWSAAPVSPATLVAAAAHAGEGNRVVWRLPAGTDLLAWLPALRAIGQRRLGPTLLIAAGDDLALAHWRALPGWWVAAPGDAGETVAVLARALGSADAVAVALPPTEAPPSTWPVGDEHEPGAGRWFGDPALAVATIACAGASLAAALAAREALRALGSGVAVLQCTSLHPLPEGELARAAARGPLVVVDVGDGATGLAAAIAFALPGVGWHGVSAWRGTPPGAADIAAAVREALAG